MRAIDKGNPPRVYANYRDCMHDLQLRIGLYCSYCELPIVNEPDVEHVHPKSRGGSLTAWNNLLLGCKKCNKIKGSKNANREGYLWPDEDNTFWAYEYSNEIMVKPKPDLPEKVAMCAQNTLTLCGIDRIPERNSTKNDLNDRRWQNRRAAWGRAERSLNNWRNQPSPALLETIGDSAQSTGFYSIWIKFFESEPEILAEIKSRFPGTYEPDFSPEGTPIARPGGRY